MAEQSMIYRNGRGQIKHYQINQISRDGTHIEAIHDGRYKKFREDSVLEWLDASDDPDSHLAYWRDNAPAKQRESTRAQARSGRADPPDKIPFPDRGKAKPKAQPDKKPRRPVQWRDFWLGFLFAVALLILLLIFAPSGSA